MQIKPIDRGFNAAIVAIAARLFPCGFDVSSNAPSTLEALRSSVARNGRMVVSSENSERTIFADAEVNFAFRAWHDWCHIALNAPFTLAGEIEAAALQFYHLVTLYGVEQAHKWRPLLQAEVVGQAEFATRTGQFPTDQVAFDLAYIARNF